MAIQNRRGVYGDFDPTKMVPGEFAVVQNGDPLSGDGKSVYIAFNAGNVKRILLDDETMPEGFTDEIKSALLSCFRNVAWINDQGQAYYDALESALYGVRWIGLNTYSLAASTTGGTAQLVATTIPAGGAVAWTSSNTTVATVSANGLVSFTGYGSATITASSNGKTATCSVLVAQETVTSISATYTQSGVVYESNVLDDLKVDLVVRATWSDASETVVSSSEYVLSGELTAGTSTVTVSYGGKTTTFNVVVSAVELVSISAVFTQGSAVIYEDDPLDSLKQYLVVTAVYNDSTTAIIPSSNYTLSGELTEGTSVITALYGGKSAAFNVPDVVDFYNVYHWNSATDSDVIEVASGICDTYTYESVSTIAYDPDRADRNVLLAKRGNSTLINFDTGEPTDRYLIPVPEDASNVKITWTGASKIALQQRAAHNAPEHIFRWVSDSGWQASSPYTTTINTSQTNGKANYMTLYIQGYNAGANPAFDVLFT